MKKHAPLFIAAGMLMLVHAVFTIEPLMRLLQVPSGVIASFMIGAPVSFDDGLVRVHAHPALTVSTACSGVRLFAILAGLGAGYWCERHLARWLALLPLAYGLTLFSNSVRIAAIWHFRRLSDGLIPEWIQEFAHMGIGMVWSLSMVAALFYWITRQPQRKHADESI